MFSSIRKHFGTAGLVVAIVALVAALAGGAIAATAGSGPEAKVSAKAKKGPRGPKGPKGSTGPAGPAGPQGAPGANGRDGANGEDGEKGKNGTNGTNGTNGAAGTSVISSVESAGDKCAEGGSKFIAGASTTYACNGEEGEEGPEGPQGEPWTAGGTLPPGETETGSWTLGPVAEGALPGKAPIQEGTSESISFTIPLEADLAEAQTHYLKPAAEPTVECPGTVADPEALAGHLCVYAQNETAAKWGFPTPIILNPATAITGASKAGARIYNIANPAEEEVEGEMVKVGAGASAYGTWAVTAATAP